MKEIRTAIIETKENEELVLVGTPIVYNSPTEINDPKGAFKEVIERGALDGAIIDDTRLLYNHSTDTIPLARSPKTMQLQVTGSGLEMRAVLPDTEHGKSVYTAVERGDMTGMSFAFTIPKGGDSYDYETRTRTIHKIQKIYEVSLVPYPAYEYATVSVEARSKIDEITQYNMDREQLLINTNKIIYKGEK